MEKNVLFIVPTDEMGGAEQIIKLLALKYQMTQNRVMVICLTKKSIKEGWKDFEGNIRYFSTRKPFMGFIYLPLFLFNEKFDLIFTSQVYINGFLGLLRSIKWYKSAKLIIRESTSVFLRFAGFKLYTYKMLYRIGYKNSDLIICQTDLMQQQLIKNVPVLKKCKIIVLHNPIDINSIIDKSGLEYEFGKIDGEFLIALGRMIPAKGFDILIESFNGFSKQFPNIKLLILGEGPEREKLQMLIIKYNLTERILMPGYCNNPFPYLKEATTCLISSRIEGYPNTLLQMMALNTNIVCTKCAGGIEEIKGIKICESNDVNSLTDSMLDALNDDNLGRNRLLFDTYLKERSIDNFIIKMEDEL